jgi:pyruvate dehydrogenase E1 component beta subunit
VAQLTLVQAINDALKVEMRRDKSVMVLGEDVGIDGGVFRATEGLLQEFGAGRIVDTPLAESGIVGAAIGLALNGMRPVAEIQFDGFMPPAFDHVVSHIGRVRWRSRGRFNVPMVIRAPYGGGIHAPEHHSESPEAYYAHTPGLKVVMPSGPYDAKGLLISAIRDPDPVIYLEPKKNYRAFREEVPENDYAVPFGKANLLKEGSDITVISWGYMARLSLQAAQMLDEQGIGVEVIDLRTLVPLDINAILASVKKTGRCVIAQEAPQTCAFGSELMTLIQEKAFDSLRAPLGRISGFDITIPLYRLEEAYMPDAGRVIRKIKEILQFS